MVTVVRDMGELLIGAQSYSARTLVLVSIMQPSRIICQECVSGKSNCSWYGGQKSHFIRKFSVTERNACRD